MSNLTKDNHLPIIILAMGVFLVSYGFASMAKASQSKVSACQVVTAEAK